ncbi:MAG: hypothetical protein GQ574_18640 [Crocinitomix sp.]|nr:hypothetical protein [Crocinitomix sp.]
MRLAQIARKVGLAPVDIKRFLESEFDQSIGNEPNYKLDEKQINAVLDKFPIPIPVVEAPVIKEVLEEPVDEFDQAVTEMEQVVEVVNELEVPAVESAVVEEETVDTIQESLDIITESGETIEENTEEVADGVTEALVDELSDAVVEVEKATEEALANETVEISEPKDALAEVEINYDEPTEAQDTEASFVEVAVDPEADLIKAPTIKLDGLKVLGKIELPGKKEAEVVEKTEEEVEQEETDALAELDAAMQLNAQDIKPAKLVSRKEAKETKEHIAVEAESYSEYKDSRGIYHFSLQQKLNREKALVRVELNQKREAEKEKKKRHYKEVMKERQQKEPVVVSKTKQKKIETKKIKREEKNAEPPKGVWAKFLSWLNN